MKTGKQTLPQLQNKLFLTDGGLETTLIFHHGIDLPHFAAFDLLKSAAGRQQLRDYYESYAQLALEAQAGFILEAPTWRANADWAARLGYSRAALDAANQQAIALLKEIRSELETATSPMVISGCIGPRGDGYVVGEQMSAADAQAYHAAQLETFAGTQADIATAMTITYAEEAIGITRAAMQADIPVVISFTTETDGRLPSGQSLQNAIETVDAETENGPAYYMINCAHPDHFSQALAEREDWVSRVRGIRANASRMSHAELDEAEELDDGDPAELGQLYRQLLVSFGHFSIIGGCCGTDHRHVAHACSSCTTTMRKAS